MSKVVSFRLDEDNFEEREALAVLEAWQAKGYSTREIMTWALMALAGTPTPEEKQAQADDEARETISELRQVLDQAQEFLQVLRNMKAVPDEVDVPSQPKPVLTEAFLASVRNKVAKPGLRLPEDDDTST
jgi:hypothetical protein